MLLFALLAVPLVLSAQENPRRPPADTIARDSVVPRDTTRMSPDSVNPDSLRPPMPVLATGEGPRSTATRWVFDPDALRWSGAISLAELLLQIPGVFAVRLGSYGQPETVTYMGQGAASLEFYRDGFQLDPLGEDSVSFDTGRFDIGQYRRIEVEVLPTVLRIHLITDTQTAPRVRTEASFSTGDAATNSYRIRYLNRWLSGAGLGVGATYLGTQGLATARGKANQLLLWGKATWMAGSRSGVEVQLNAYTHKTEAVEPFFAGVPYAGRDVKRSDLFVRAFASSRDEGMGLRMDALLGSSSYSDSAGTLDQHVSQAALTLGYRAGRLSAESWARVRDKGISLDLGARGAFSPFRLLTVSGSARHREGVGGGSWDELAPSAEVRLLSWLSLHGDLRWRRIEGRRFVAADTAETVTDWTAGLALNHRLFSIDAAMTSRGLFSAPVPGVFEPQLPTPFMASTSAPQITWRFQPRPWISLSGWYRAPSSDSVPYDPPTHSVSRLTFRSSFLPHFRRGAFDLELLLELEAWGTGIMGADSIATPQRLVGHSVWNAYLQFRLVGAIIYWTMRNTQRERYQLLPGYIMPRSLQRFGIRWEFTN